ncbi:hypothetical protein ACNG34_002963 [Enterococcus faecium]
MTEKEKCFGKKNWLVKLIGSYAVVVFLDGKKMLGKVLDVTQYEIILKRESIKNPIIIPKHAIKYLYEREEE